MSEATQAGERLRRHRAEWSEQYRDTQQGSDEATLAAEYLRLTDPTKIDEAWLRSIGFKDFAGAMIVIRNSEDDCVAFTLPNCRYLFVNGRGVYGTKTRGQLRCLLMGLGITPPTE